MALVNCLAAAILSALGHALSFLSQISALHCI
jgi:hypothetical protein